MVPEEPQPVEARHLEDVRVCMLRAADYLMDARARKQAAALAEAGAHVSMVGQGSEVAADLIESGYDIRLIPTPWILRLGREDVWWPVRVAVNLTHAKILEMRSLAKRRPFVYSYENLLVAYAKRQKPDVIHAYDIHTLTAAVRIKRETGARIVYDVLDMYSEEAYLSSKVRRQLSEAEAESISSTDAVITVSEPLAELIASRYGVPRPTVIYNGPGEVVQSPRPAHEPVRLLFQGSFAHNRNLVALIEMMGEFRGRATLTMQGFGGIESELRERISALDLEGVVIFVPPVAPLDVVAAASSHDVGVVCHLGESFNHRAAVPNKLMDYLGAGLAVAVSDLPGHRSVLEDTGAAAFIDPTSAASMAEGLRRLLDEPKMITEMKRAALEVARHYAWAIQAKRMIGVYESVLNGER